MALLDILQEIKNETGPMFKSLFIMPVSLRNRLRIKEVLDKDEYKQEVDLLLKAVGSSYFSQINVSSEKPKVIREVIEDFQKTHKVSEEDAVRIIGYFATLLDCKMPKEYSLSVPATKGSSDDLARKATLDALMATGKQPIPPKPVVQQVSTPPVSQQDSMQDSKLEAYGEFVSARGKMKVQQEPMQNSKLEGRLDKLEARIEDCVQELRAMQSQLEQLVASSQVQDLSKVIAELQAKEKVLFSNLEARKKLLIGTIQSYQAKEKDLETNFDERIEKLEWIANKLNNANSQVSIQTPIKWIANKLNNANSQASIQALISQALTDSLGDIQEQIQKTNELIQAQTNDIVELENNKTSIEGQLMEISNYRQDITKSQDELFHKLEALEKQQTEKEKELSESINTTNSIVKNSVIPSLVDKDKKLKELEATVEQLNVAISTLNNANSQAGIQTPIDQALTDSSGVIQEQIQNNMLIQAQANDILELKNNKTSIKGQLMEISNYRQGITKSQDELFHKLEALEKQQTEKEQKLSESINTTNNIVKNSVVPSLVDKDKKLKELETTVEQLDAAISTLNNANSQASVQTLISQALTNLPSVIQEQIQNNVLIQAQANDILELKNNKTSIEGQLSQISKYLQDANLLGITKNQNASSDRLKALEEQQTQLERLEAELKRLGSIQNTNKPASAASSISEPEVPVSEVQEPKTTLETFNDWAAKPSAKLPLEFYYLKNSMTRMTRCELTKSNNNEPTKWIVNKTAPLYLFPNPNFFTPHTDISEFYDMDITKLKPRGQNRIKVTVPCEMTETGYVHDAGKLDLV